MIGDQCKIFIWNCRGTAGKEFLRVCNNYIRMKKPGPRKLGKKFSLLGFDGYECTVTMSYAGGIAMAWKEEKVIIDIVNKDFQFLHAKVVKSGT